jgi:hypothetical protein
VLVRVRVGIWDWPAVVAVGDAIVGDGGCVVFSKTSIVGQSLSL